jgi:GntR family transcriptional regulator/MocR family aminotransferase
MSNARTTSQTDHGSDVGIDLLLELKGSRVRSGITNALRNAIRSGRLRSGLRLPSSRALAADLGVARSTVTECYAELVAEGWLAARQGSGTRVAEVVQSAAVSDAGAAQPPPERAIGGLVPGAADFADFPRQPWLAAARRALASAPYSAFGYGDPAGDLRLRAALAGYLARVRGVQADPGHVLICSGFHHGLGLVGQALRRRGATGVAVEAYGLGLYRDVLARAGLRIPALTVDTGGARVDELNGASADAALLTPAHQFPTGVALSSDRRAEFIRWAQRTGGWILEDDYDGEFRYDRASVGALQGLDPDHVVYFGTASKSVAPALRIGWIVAPQRLMPDLLDAKGPVDTVGVLDQLILAEFITSGAFDRSVRLRRGNYRRRREELVAALADAAPHARVIGMQAGLQAVIALPSGGETAAMKGAAARGLVVSGLSEFRHPDADPDDALGGIVINFSAISESAWPSTLALLIGAIS